MKRWLLSALCIAIAACSGEAGATAHPGTLPLRLTSGGGNDGAVIIVVSGGPITSVAGAGDYQVATNADGRGTHILVAGNIGVGVLATISVPDTSRRAAYVVTVEQVSDRDSFALRDPARYVVVVGDTP